MEERNKKVNETGERKADGSVRFASHPSNTPLEGVIEVLHNLVTYAKTKGKIIIQEIGHNLCTYRFYNDATKANVPTFEKLVQIAKNAGKSISSGQGVSLCGIGIEIFGLKCRPTASSTTSVHITVVREKMRYGTILTFNGYTQQVSYEIIEPQSVNAENSFEITGYGCKKLSKNELIMFKRKIVDMMPKHLTITLTTDESVEVLNHVDFLYRNELMNTENYKRYDFHLSNGEPLILELSDVGELVKSGKGNKFEEHSTCSPDLSGGVFRYKDIATVCRGDYGWKFAGAYKGTHSTRNNIRFEINGGKYLFTELHKEAQVKSNVEICISELKDEYRDRLKIYDEQGNEYDISIISSLVKEFNAEHKTDKDYEKKSDDQYTFILNKIKGSEISLKQIEDMLNMFNVLNIDEKMKIKTIKNTLTSICNNKEEIQCFNCAE